MKGKKKRLFSTVVALFLAFLMIGHTVGINTGSAIAASTRGWDDDWDDWEDEDGEPLSWAAGQMMRNIKTDKKVYYVGQDTKVVVSFDVRVAPSKDNKDKLLFVLQAQEGLFSDPVNLAQKEVPVNTLTVGTNKVEIPYAFPTEEKRVVLYIYSYAASNSVDNDVEFSVKKPDSNGGGSGGSDVPTTDYWNLKEQVSNLKTDKDTYQMGSEQTINVSFDVAKLPDSFCRESSNDIYIIVADSTFDLNDMLDPTEVKGIIASTSTTVSKLKGGTNTFALKARFSSKGLYYVYVAQANLNFTESQRIDFTVVAATDGNGNVINTKGSVRPQYCTYSAKQAATMKIFYSIDDSNSKYHLYVRKGIPLELLENGAEHNYSDDQKYVVADFMTGQDLPTEMGKELSVTLNKGEDDFKYKGVYTVILYNMTTKKFVAQQKFYVILEKFVIQRDATKMKDDGTIPFYCDADLRNFDMDKDEKYSFQVCFPLNFQKYYKELNTTYDYCGLDEDIDEGEGPETDDLDNIYLSDDYTVNMTVSYVPEGSKESRKLFKKKITGMYKAHTITLSSKEILKAIYDTNKFDIGYAGVVTVKFSNKDDFQDIANDAILKFTESFQFGVSKSESITSAEAAESNVELAYMERARFNIKETLGGKIYADIYKGNDKIDTVEGSCQIKKDGTAAGSVEWELTDKNGNYVDEEGEYTAKVYTVNEYDVFEQDGSSNLKKVTSEEKTIKFSLKKPNRKLTLSTKVTGDSGGNAVYVEKPVIGVILTANIGVSVSVSIKGSGGNELRDATALCKKGKRCISINLSGSRIKAGTYKAVVTAETLDGQKKTSTATFHVKKLPKSSIQSVSVSSNSSTGLGGVSFKISEFANVTVMIKSGNNVLQKIIDQSYSAGDIKTSFSIGGYTPGFYKVVIVTQNSGGKKSVSRSFEVKKKPVIVKKPTISNLSVRFLAGKDGDMVQGTFSYTGKNSKVIIDIMYNDTEEIVYTYQGVTKNDSGSFTYTWDGFKSNGFRCWPGSYTYRVHLVNSAGSTPYLRQNFTLGAG
ncbi:MAG: hypothetical protein J5819_08325 [Eubacterium sp.]|nr:hypothetical protein [Eubacterium sp.]